ncbi:rhomboid family intramembrane serine protease [Citreimonas salinaria]|uniref:Rhomboid family protein n=1 Tax=Citreimonas salinaria TaxID=321339 RepID=A0A1H3I3U1_9RHOB|nr:rhomboid family intramembrane serine protease [Citreimonas salinaria]SDY21839.1 Rhomboid family protein [Citreimonas salinaria]
MVHPHNENPVNPLPPAVVALALVTVGIEAIFGLGARGLLGGPEAVGWRLAAIERYAFSPEILRWMVETGRYPPEHLLRIVSYPFVHAGFTHALFAAVMLLALGKIVAETIGGAAMLAVFVVSTVGGALLYSLLPGSVQPLFGAFPPVYGLIGAFTYLLWVRLGQVGAQQLRAFSLIGVLLGIQLVFGVLFGGGLDWVADVAGFAAGFLLTIVLVPGGFHRLLARLRRG